MVRRLAATAALALLLGACGSQQEAPFPSGAASSAPASDGDSAGSDPSATPTGPDPAAPATPSGPLTDAALLEVEDVPARERLAPWREAEPASEAVLACQAEPLSALGADAVVRRTFVADIAGAPAGGDPSSVVDLAVLQYADRPAAEAARDRVQGQVRGCSTTLDGLPVADRIPGSHQVGDPGTGTGAGARWWQRDFLAPDVCQECDAVRFHRMAVGLAGDRLVLVSLAEVGGPLQPEGLDPTMEALVEAALARSAS